MQLRQFVFPSLLGLAVACGGAESHESTAEQKLETTDNHELARPAELAGGTERVGEKEGRHECTVRFKGPRAIAAGGSPRMFWFSVVPDAPTTLSLEAYPGSTAEALFDRNQQPTIDFFASGGANIIGTAKSDGPRDMFLVVRQNGALCGSFGFSVISATPRYHYVGPAAQIPASVTGGAQFGNRMVDEIVHQGDDPLGFRNERQTATGGIVVQLDLTPPGLDPSDLELDKFSFWSSVDRRDYDEHGCVTGESWVDRTTGARDSSHYLQFEDAHPDIDIPAANRWTPHTLSVWKYTHVILSPTEMSRAGTIAAPVRGAMVSTRQNGTDKLYYKGDVLGEGSWTFGATMSFDGRRWAPDIAIGGDNWLEEGTAWLNFGFETTDDDVSVSGLNPNVTRRGAFFAATLSGSGFVDGPQGCLPRVQINNGHDVYQLTITDVRDSEIDVQFRVPRNATQTQYNVEIFRGDSSDVLQDGLRIQR